MKLYGEESMKRIALTQNKVALVDNADYGWLNQRKWFAVKNGRCYYAGRHLSKSDSASKRIIFMHREIIYVPDGLEIDHINGNGLDNQRSNLCLCTHRENSRKQRLGRNNKTGFKGVNVDRRISTKPYYAYIWVDNKRIYIGYYQTAKLAAQSYDQAALKYYGEFALTNEMLGLFGR